MKSTLKLAVLTALASAALVFTSCEKEPECKRCGAVQEMYMDGQLQSTQTISPVEYCDDDLEQIESNSVIEVNQNMGGINQRSVLTYTCD